MHSKVKWLSLWVIVALMLVSLAAVTYAAPDVVDNDQDGLNATQEAALGTSDSNPDSDGDGLCDGNYLAATNAGCAATWGIAGDDGIVGTADDPWAINPLFQGEDLNLNGVVDAGETNPAKKDTDGDLMDDGWELLYSNFGTIPTWPTINDGPVGCGATDPLTPDAGNDPDPASLLFPSVGDGLTNLEEYNGYGGNQLNPCDQDTDNDLKLDGNEVKGIGGFTNPFNPDTDGDGLCDSVENKGGIFLQPHGVGGGAPPAPLPYPVNANAITGLGTGAMYPNPGACMTQWTSGYYAGSDPTVKDTDGDGIWDGVEASGSSNKWNTIAPAVPTGPTGHISDPNKKDTDGDGIEDGVELNYVGGNGALGNKLNMDPSQTDTDKDGMPDKYEYDRQNCGFGGLDPTQNDANGDVDGDGLWNITEYNGVDGVNATADDAKFSDACKVDTDGDGMNDGFEFFYSKAALGNMPGVGPLDPTVDDTALDPDKDAASNYTEYMGVDKQIPLKRVAPDPDAGKFFYPPTGDNTDPSNPNTDTDQFIDGFEYWANWDPAQTACPAAALGFTRMDPRWTNDDALPADPDADTLTNQQEYRGKDAKVPVAADIVGLFPGDLKGTAWTVDDPYFWFQKSGNFKDATNPCNADTDRGGYKDGIEVTVLPGMDPNWKTDDKTKDHDFDGIPTYTEDASHDGVYQATETDWYDPDTDKDGLCDGKKQVDGLLNGGAKVQLVGAYGNHKIMVVGGVWYSDFNDNDIYYPADAGDLFVCGGGEDLDGNGKIAGDTNNDHGWLPLGANGIWENGAGDDEVFTETDPRHPDTDLDGLCDGKPVGNFGLPNNPPCTGSEDENVNAVAAERGVSETSPLDADTDDDQLGDGLEKTSACLDEVDEDSDNDGLWDGFKAIQQYVDANGDGIQLGNGFGFAVWMGYDGADNILGNADDQPGEDTSLNGVVDLDETNPCSDDTDKDGVKDGVEYTFYESPLHKTAAPWDTSFALKTATDIDADLLRPALDPDADGDSLCDGDVKNAANTGCNLAAPINQIIGEDLNGNGASPAPETNPMDPDTDNDSVWDGVEVTWYETFNCKTWLYEDYNLAGYVHSAQWDCDKDGVRDALDTDSDNDKLPDGFIDGANGRPADGAFQPGEGEDSNYNGGITGDLNGDRTKGLLELWQETDPLSADTDGDGVPDGAEVLSPVVGCFNPTMADSDLDGLLDGQEDRNHDGILAGDTGLGDPTDFGKNDGVIQFNEVWKETSPCNNDTDGDNVRDYVEVWGWEFGGLITTGPMPDPDKDGKINAVDPDSDNDTLCDAALVVWQQNSVAAGGLFPVDWQRVCAGGEDDGDGVIGYGGFFTNKFSFAGNLWMPPHAPGVVSFPVPWLTYFAVSPAQIADFAYPVSIMPNGVSAKLGVGDWDRDRVIDDSYDVPGPLGLNQYTLVEDWGETDPLNADSDRDGVADAPERRALYAGLNQKIPGMCNGGALNWGPVTDDQDGDGLLDGAEDKDGDGYYFWELPNINDMPTMGGTGTQPVPGTGAGAGVETDPCGQDSDGDGVTDGQEVNVLKTGPADTDSDDDSWTDGQEVLGQVPGPNGTKQVCDPTKKDTDGDMLSDGEEGAAGVDGYLTFCATKDSDHGGVNDYDEYYILRVKGGVSGDPLNPVDDTADTDGDGISNYAELTDPVNTCLDPKKADSDGDTLKDGDELSGVKNVKYGKQPTSPCKLDSDGDQISDSDEITWTGTDPNKADTDGDGLLDNYELFVTHTDPTKADSDGDGLTDGQEINTTHTDPMKADTDGDGLSDGDEINKTHTDPLKADTDGDGMGDGYEAMYDCLNPLVKDANADPDGDGYTNIQEMGMGTDPCVFNCDIKYDWDKNSVVTVADVLMMTPHWQETPASAGWVAAYDVDGDGVITVIDFMIVVNHIGDTCLKP